MATFDKRNQRLQDEIDERQIERMVRRMLQPMPAVNRASAILGDNDVSGYRDTAGVYQAYWLAGDVVTDDGTSAAIAP